MVYLHRFIDETRHVYHGYYPGIVSGANSKVRMICRPNTWRPFVSISVSVSASASAPLPGHGHLDCAIGMSHAHMMRIHDAW